MQKWPKAFVPTLLIGIFTTIFMTPLLWLFISAFRPEIDILGHLSPLSWEIIVPKRLSIENFVALWQAGFWLPVFNSVFVAFATVALGLLINSMAAFALSAIEFPGRSIVLQ